MPPIYYRICLLGKVDDNSTLGVDSSVVKWVQKEYFNFGTNVQFSNRKIQRIMNAEANGLHQSAKIKLGNSSTPEALYNISQLRNNTMFFNSNQDQQTHYPFLFVFIPLSSNTTSYVPAFFSNPNLLNIQNPPQNQYPQLQNYNQSSSIHAPQNPINTEDRSQQEDNRNKSIGLERRATTQRITNRRNIDEEFKPNVQASIKKRSSFQNTNRNIVPNIIHQIFSYLQKKSKSERHVLKLLGKLPLGQQASVRRFYLYQNMIKNKTDHYVCTESLRIFLAPQDEECQLYSIEEQLEYLKISRILICLFLRREFQNIILTSKRVNCGKRKSHLEYRRKILEESLKYFCPQKITGISDQENPY